MSENWNYYVEGFLPLGFARFCFFDNEKISQIIDDDSFTQIKESIKTIIGVTTVEMLINDMERLTKKKLQEVRLEVNEDLETKRAIVEAEMDEVQNQIRTKKLQETKTKVMIASLQEQLDKAEDEFWSKGGTLGVNRETIELQKQNLQTESKNLKTKIFNLIGQPNSPLILCEGLLRQA